MAASFCLPKKYSSVFLDALKSGKLNPDDLRDMSSAERRTAFSEILGGDENARQVNILFESKLLLKDQQKGMIEWAKSVGGLNDKTRQTIVDKIQSMNQILQPADEKSFLEDLARDRLDATVTAEEAQKLFDASEEVRKQENILDNAQGEIRDNFIKYSAETWSDAETARINYGNSVNNLTDLVESLKPSGRTVWDNMINVLNIPKSMLTSILHFSAPVVQGFGLIGSKAWGNGFLQMFRYFGKEENFQNLRAYIISHPDYPLALDGKLRMTDISDKLSNREEALQSTLVQKASEIFANTTHTFDLVRGSSRAFTGYLNYVRFAKFTELLKGSRLLGEDIQIGSPLVREWAKFVNDRTGAGAIGVDDSYGNITPALNVGIFSPRKISATINMYNPLNYVNPNITSNVRIAAWKQLTGQIIVTGSVLGLASAMGVKVDLNPTSQDFLKLQIGKEKLDMTGGNSGYIRLWARILSGQEVTAKGITKDLTDTSGLHPTTRAEIISQYVRGKLSPVAGTLADYLYGSDPIGKPFNISSEIQNKLIPITIKSFIDFAHNNPDDTAAIIPSLSAIFGVGLESPLPPTSRTGLTVWGDPVSVWHDPVRNNIDKEFDRLGYTPGFPGQTIMGVKLTDDQYHSYVALAGSSAKMMLNQLISSPGWSQVPDPQKLSLMKSVVAKYKETAQTAIMLQALHSENDIFAKSIQNQKDKLLLGTP